ncbi:ParB family chromosome partitioning protein [Geothermobacter ehrlichii]|uniref:ParB family chromosome partitioning protein n=1 Tax=Geothermobacter ehrlichii TaxID=213224 RepID=A0A5D3WJ32_9BACT|nr:ParB/RepB/Spo0J family partition protein [Geothermobacter ehrlichii]TYO97659.1 ParB family chromosome partitioning protein [Geothermobacter ehrlichii]
MAKRPALGKGIGALISSAGKAAGNETAGASKYFLCPIEELKPHGRQPRKTFDGAKMAELVASIREKGVIQPLVVRKQDGHYQIIAGERRWRAAQKAGLKEVPVVIQDVSEDWALEMALIENIQREDLNPIEEAEAYRHLMESFDLSQEEVARRVGRERSTVANMLRLLKLPGKVRSDVIAGELSMGHARALLGLEDEEDILEARDQVVARKLSVRECEALVKKIKNFGQPSRSKSEPAPVDPELKRLEEELKRALGTQVRILPRGKGGKVEISYFSAEELERILALLGVD